MIYTTIQVIVYVLLFVGFVFYVVDMAYLKFTGKGLPERLYPHHYED